MDRVKRTEVVIVHPQQRIMVVQRNFYIIKVDRGRSCYACGEIGHMAQYCRNRGERTRIGNGRRLEYGQRWGREGNFEQSDNLKEEKNLKSLD